ncbi:MAG: FAD-dependent oxidoreductase [Tannerella sp.]|nr:FAD-dependent oxidoreductase [Tannerella sp.]
MKRREFLNYGITAGVMSSLPSLLLANCNDGKTAGLTDGHEIASDIVIIGGGLGGSAAALAALRNGLKVIMTEETDWIGGQLTQQGVPPDEHPWIETHGSTKAYRDFRNAIRSYYHSHYPLTADARARQYLNPGDGEVSRLCCEPRVALAALYDIFNPYISSGKLILLLNCKAVAADVTADRVRAVKVAFSDGKGEQILHAQYFVDATEMGDLLPLTGTEFVRGAEARKDTDELHAAETADPDNQQSFTLCFAMDYIKDRNFVGDKPENYDYWRNFIPPLTPPWSGKLLDLSYSTPSTLVPKLLGFHPEGVPTGNALNLWNYRRIINKNNFTPGFYDGDITIVNWPQNDYMLGNPDTDFDRHVAGARQLSHALFYWLQTECPRPDGGQGWAGLRLRGDVLGTADGMAKYPYIRESRRIKALFTVLEEHVGKEQRVAVSGRSSAAEFADSVGVGYYHIDLHPSTKGNNYIDFDSLPFQIPLGALIPQRIENLLPACKNIGTTHITNGCYRLHPVEWNIGESVGCLVAYAIQHKTTPHAVREKQDILSAFRSLIRAQGIETEWPAG